MPITYDLVSEGRKLTIELEGLSWQLRRQKAHSLQPELERLHGVSTVAKDPDKRISTITVMAEAPDLVPELTTGIEAVLKRYDVSQHHHEPAMMTA